MHLPYFYGILTQIQTVFFYIAFLERVYQKLTN